MWTGRPSAAVALAVVLSLLMTGCDGDDPETPVAESTSTTIDEGPVAATAVAVGDCLNGIVIGAAERAEISSAQVVDCRRAHALEVYATFTLRADDLGVEVLADYPGPARVVSAAEQGCATRIEELIGEPVAFGLIALWPSARSWSSGDRTVACAVFSRDGTPFEGRQL